MKRCNNCGWGENPDTNTRCEKCNGLLDGNTAVDNYSGGCGNTMGDNAVNLKRTVIEANASYANGSTNQQSHRKTNYRDITEVEPGTCPECGYPMRKGGRTCPQCHTVIEGYASEEVQPRAVAPRQQEARVQPVRVQGSSSNEFKKTIAPGRHKRNKINLTAINAYDENDFVPLALTFSDEQNLLKRDNVEADNPTISRSEHAMLSLENGKWFLENRSSGLATSLVLTQKHELQPGDIVIIGDRVFEISF